MHTPNDVSSWKLMIVTVYIFQQPTLIKIEFFLSKYMLLLWLQARQRKTEGALSYWNNPYPLQQSPKPFRSCFDYNIEQPPTPCKMSMCKWWWLSGEGWENLYWRQNQNNSQSIHAAHAVSLPLPLRGTAGLQEPIAADCWRASVQCARVLSYFPCAALSSRRGNQFSFGQQQQVQL